MFLNLANVPRDLGSQDPISSLRLTLVLQVIERSLKGYCTVMTQRCNTPVYCPHTYHRTRVATNYV